MSKPCVALAAAILACIPSLSALSSEPAKEPDLLAQAIEQTKWRSLGPATMGGRIADIAVDPAAPYTYYAAMATGGLIKTTNNGTTWTPLFDTQPVASVGAVAITPGNAKIVWAGTGEANGRNSSSWGNGIYKSTDSGTTWTNMGLKESQEIARIVVDPKAPDTVFAAVAGKLWGPGKERGVYMTMDGGKTWKQSLAIDENTGAIDVALGAPGSGVVYAAAYQRRRYPWGFSGVNPGSAIYKSADSGKTWKKLTNGLPAGPIGRIGLATSISKPATVYAVIESPAGGQSGLFDNTSKYGGVFRSDDAGETWKRMSGTAPRGFYFGQIRVDPTNADRVYVLGFDLAVSEDSGRKFTSKSTGVHSDLHALYIDPAHPDHLILGTDGGIYVSYDKAEHWAMQANFPMGEFYEVATDNAIPYNVYGGLQDNGSWEGPSSLLAGGGPSNSDWKFLEGGDGFYVKPDLVDTDIVYAESQNGSAARTNQRTHQRRYFRPAPLEGSPGYKFNWNAPMFISRYDHDSVYIGGNHLFRWYKQGEEYEPVSPDLTRQAGERITADGSGAENYGTIVALSESPRNRGEIWAGTDDGNVELTRDGGKTWTNVTGNLPARVRDFYVTRVLASSAISGRAYVTIDGHRSDNFAPWVFVTDDFGASWRSITSGLPSDGPVKAIAEDPVNPDLLFLGTEFGAWMSTDRGGKWVKLQSGLPTVAVNDLAIQPRDHALVAATHGRSLYAADDIAVLEDLTPSTLKSNVHLFPIRPAVEHLGGGGGWFGGSGAFQAANASTDVDIPYWVRGLYDKPVTITITDAAGKTMTTLTGDRIPGLHRVSWDMHQKPEEGVEQRPGRAPLFVKPGTYTATLTLDKEKQVQKFTITGQHELSEIPSDDSVVRD